MALFWLYRGGQDRGPYFLAVTRVDDARAACARISEPFPSPRVHELTSPVAVDLCEGLDEGAAAVLELATLPSVYDRFRAGRTYRDMDWDAMAEQGFDVL